MPPSSAGELVANFSKEERLLLYEYTLRNGVGVAKPPELLTSEDVLSSHTEKTEELTPLELEKKMRDFKRRRQAYRTKVSTKNKSQVLVTREIIQNMMVFLGAEETEQATEEKQQGKVEEKTDTHSNKEYRRDKHVENQIRNEKETTKDYKTGDSKRYVEKRRKSEQHDRHFKDRDNRREDASCRTSRDEKYVEMDSDRVGSYQHRSEYRYKDKISDREDSRHRKHRDDYEERLHNLGGDYKERHRKHGGDYEASVKKHHKHFKYESDSAKREQYEPCNIEEKVYDKYKKPRHTFEPFYKRAETDYRETPSRHCSSGNTSADDTVESSHSKKRKKKDKKKSKKSHKHRKSSVDD